MFREAARSIHAVHIGHDGRSVDLSNPNSSGSTTKENFVSTNFLLVRLSGSSARDRAGESVARPTAGVHRHATGDANLRTRSIGLAEFDEERNQFDRLETL